MFALLNTAQLYKMPSSTIVYSGLLGPSCGRIRGHRYDLERQIHTAFNQWRLDRSMKQESIKDRVGQHDASTPAHT